MKARFHWPCPQALPLDDSIGGVRRPLTPTEQQLVAQFGWVQGKGEQGRPCTPQSCLLPV